VQGACLAWALDAGDCHGVWGATTPRERRAMAVVWRDETVPTEARPSALGEVVILPSQRQPMIVEALNRAVRVAS
jgi:WhiB family transcriptional regulator, redox-sensing transcriptional regulator